MCKGNCEFINLSPCYSLDARAPRDLSITGSASAAWCLNAYILGRGGAVQLLQLSSVLRVPIDTGLGQVDYARAVSTPLSAVRREDHHRQSGSKVRCMSHATRETAQFIDRSTDDWRVVLLLSIVALTVLVLSLRFRDKVRLLALETSGSHSCQHERGAMRAGTGAAGTASGSIAAQP